MPIYDTESFLVGWIASLRAFGDIFDIQFFFALHLIMTILMCITWLILFVLTIVAFWKGLIFRSKDEDVIKDFQGVPEDEKADMASSIDVSAPLPLGYDYNLEVYTHDSFVHGGDRRV